MLQRVLTVLVLGPCVKHGQDMYRVVLYHMRLCCALLSCPAAWGCGWSQWSRRRHCHCYAGFWVSEAMPKPLCYTATPTVHLNLKLGDNTCTLFMQFGVMLCLAYCCTFGKLATAQCSLHVLPSQKEPDTHTHTQAVSLTLAGSGLRISQALLTNTTGRTHRMAVLASPTCL
jgi:hypothetical protein